MSGAVSDRVLRLNVFLRKAEWHTGDFDKSQEERRRKLAQDIAIVFKFCNEYDATYSYEASPFYCPSGTFRGFASDLLNVIEDCSAIGGVIKKVKDLQTRVRKGLQNIKNLKADPRKADADKAEYNELLVERKVKHRYLNPASLCTAVSAYTHDRVFLSSDISINLYTTCRPSLESRLGHLGDLLLYKCRLGARFMALTA
ncbi:hypothetical protein F5Y18DRAFT_424757 [Xylariaceae sp. FL1019]|nr:hypothetical protein F5Y18DRAFT_424757 [Xylariaceae sp. FL1019]